MTAEQFAMMIKLQVLAGIFQHLAYLHADRAKDFGAQAQVLCDAELAEGTVLGQLIFHANDELGIAILFRRYLMATQTLALWNQG